MKNLTTLLLLIFIALIFALTLKGNLGNPSPPIIEQELRERGQPFELSPERGRYALTQSLAEDKSFFLRPEIARYVTPDLGYLDGKYLSLFSPGISILATPLYLIGAQFNIAQVATFSLSAIFALLNFALIVKICQQLGLSLRSGLIAALTYLLATPAFAYSVSFYQHQTTAFLLLATTALLFSKINLIKLTLSAFLSTFSFWIDSQNPIFFVPLVVYGLICSFKVIKVKENIKISIPLINSLAIFGAIVVAVGYMFYSNVVYNHPLKLSGTVQSIGSFNEKNEPVPKRAGEEKIALRFFNPRHMIHGTSTLITSQDRGIVLYSPIILFAIFGIPYMFQKEKQKVLILLSTILVVFTLYTMWGDPYGGWAFGPRYLIPAFGLSSIFLAATFDKFWQKFWFKITFSALFTYSVAVNLLGALTTNQVPPKVEAVPLNMKWNFLLNWDMFVQGQTSSFIYKTFLVQNIPLIYYSLFILATIIFLGLLLIWHPQREAKIND